MHLDTSLNGIGLVEECSLIFTSWHVNIRDRTGWLRCQWWADDMSKVMTRKMATQHFSSDDDIVHGRGVFAPSCQTNDSYCKSPNKKLLMTKGVHHPNRPLADQPIGSTSIFSHFKFNNKPETSILLLGIFPINQLIAIIDSEAVGCLSVLLHHSNCNQIHSLCNFFR